MHQQSALLKTELAQMSFLLKHLEQKWGIKKRNNVYILKQSASGSKLMYTASYLDAHLKNATHATHATHATSVAAVADGDDIKQSQLLTFLHNALEDGWNIKKHSDAPNKYVFMKKHNGHREIYEDDEYLTQFIKNNLRLQ
jgi:hypothetical protein